MIRVMMVCGLELDGLWVQIKELQYKLENAEAIKKKELAQAAKVLTETKAKHEVAQCCRALSLEPATTDGACACRRRWMP